MAATTSSPPPGLRRELGLRGAVALGVGGTIGGGIYVLVGRAAGEAGPGALISFAIAFVAALLIALPYAELSCRYPVAGGGYAFAREVFGQRVGFLMGWGFWGAYVFISGFVTLGFGGYLHGLTGLPLIPSAVVLLVVVLVLNLLGVKVSGRAQVAVMCVAIVGLLVFACWGLPHLRAHNLEPFVPHGLNGVLSASLLAFLAFGGFDMIAAAGEEIHRPERNLPRAILITLAVVLGLYLLVCFVAVASTGAGGLGASKAPLADAARRIGGAPLRRAITFIALLTTAATANAVLIVTSRISFAMARDRLLPGPLAATSSRTGAPWAALILSGALMAAVAAAGSVALAAAAGGFLYVLHFMLPPSAVISLQRRDERATPTALRTPAPTITVPLAMLACVALLTASGWSGAAVGSAWLSIGVLGYIAATRRSRGPTHV